MNGSWRERLERLDRRVLGPPTALEHWPRDRHELMRYLLTGQGRPPRPRPSASFTVAAVASAIGLLALPSLGAPVVVQSILVVVWLAGMLVLFAREHRRQAAEEMRNRPTPPTQTP